MSRKITTSYTISKPECVSFLCKCHNSNLWWSSPLHTLQIYIILCYDANLFTNSVKFVSSVPYDSWAPHTLLCITQRRRGRGPWCLKGMREYRHDNRFNGVGVTKAPRLIIMDIHDVAKSYTRFLNKITFIFDKCHRRSAAGTRVKYERDIRYVIGVWLISTMVKIMKRRKSIWWHPRTHPRSKVKSRSFLNHTKCHEIFYLILIREKNKQICK